MDDDDEHFYMHIYHQHTFFDDVSIQMFCPCFNEIVCFLIVQSLFTFETLFFLIATQTPHSPVLFLSLRVPQSSLFILLTLFLFTPSF